MNDAQPIRVVVLDLDGTLLHPDKRLAGGAAAMVDYLSGRGVVTLIATARPPRSTFRYVNELSAHPLTVNYNGAVVWDVPGNRAVHHVPIEADLVKQVRELVLDHPGVESLNYEVTDRWYFEPLHDGARLEVNDTARAGFAPDMVGALPLFGIDAATKIMPFLPGGGARGLADRLSARFDGRLYVVCTDETLVQVSAAGVNKADALERVFVQLGVDWSMALAAGDNHNDLEMLRRASVTVVPRHAPEAVLAEADEVVEDPEGIVARILARLGGIGGVRTARTTEPPQGGGTR